jgi:hypothetical protein
VSNSARAPHPPIGYGRYRYEQLLEEGRRLGDEIEAFQDSSLASAKKMSELRISQVKPPTDPSKFTPEGS